MKIELNLLPDKNKKKIKTKKYFWLIFEQELYVVIAILILVLGLLGINFLITYEINSLKNVIKIQKERGDSKEIEKIRSKFVDTNAKVRNIDSIIKNSISWNYIFTELSYLVDEKIAIKSITIENTSIIINAVANKRTDAIEFKNKVSKINIEGKPCFGEVVVPAEDLVSSEFVKFNLTAPILRNCVILNKNSNKETNAK